MKRLVPLIVVVAISVSVLAMGWNAFAAPAMPEIPKADLYGKTVDQDGKAVPGVEVHIAQQSLPPIREWEPFKAVSDRKGMVVFPGLRYGVLQLKIQNDAYLLDPALDRYLESGLQFGHSDRPEEKGLGVSPAKPYVWRLWKKRGLPQPFVTGLVVVSCPSEGTPVPVDLLDRSTAFGAHTMVWSPGIPPSRQPRPTTGTATTSATATAGGTVPQPPPEVVDVKVSVTRSAEDKFMVTKPWSFSVEAPLGGIVETDDTFMYLAPKRAISQRLRRPSSTAGASRSGCF